MYLIGGVISDIIDFKYKHTLKLYEYIKSIDLNIVKIEYTKLRKILELVDLYNRDTDFKKVIINSIAEINTKAASIKIEAKFEKKNSFYFVDFIISRFDTTNNNKAGTIIEIGYQRLIEQECLINKKKYIMEDIIADEKNNEYSMHLKEKNNTRVREFEFESKKGLIEKLKNLFEGKFTISSLEDVHPITINTDKKELTSFKKDVINNFKGSFLINNAPGFLEEQRLFLNESGLITKEDGVIIDKEKAFAVWEYVYENKDKIGVYEDVEPIKIFIGEVLERHVKNSLFGTSDIIKYKVDEIKKEGLNYRLYLKDEAGSIEVGKNTLNYKQLAALMDKKVI